MPGPRSTTKPRSQFEPGIELLECRVLPSICTPFIHLSPNIGPLSGGGPAGGYTPGQVKQGYGFTPIDFGGVIPNGSGQTIAIVDAFNDPNIFQDLRTFDRQFLLPAANLVVVNQTGGSALPGSDPGWASEESLDVEWAHAMAPEANLVLIEANDDSTANLLPAVAYASTVASVVSMSWGSPEMAGEASLDQFLSTPGVTYVASSGDSGAPCSWPAVSTHVLAVGGTTLTLDGNNNWAGESGWSGSGGGISAYLPQPSYQHGVVTQTSAQRTNPDVAFDGDPNTGVSIYDSYQSPGWLSVGGTSFSAPAWAGIIAVANQGRALRWKAPLDYNQTLSTIYQMPKGDFHDVTTGDNGYSSGAGYDLVTGRGSPVTYLVLNDLIRSGPSVLPPGSGNAGSGAAASFAELGAYRPSNGTWSLDSNGTSGFQFAGPEGQAPLSDRQIPVFSPTGASVTPVSGDWAGLGTTEIGDFEAGLWHLDLTNDGIVVPADTFSFGTSGDVPVPGDYLAKGQMSLAVFRSLSTGVGEFLISDANWLAEGLAGKPIGIAESFLYGAAGDRVVVGDWNGAGLTEVGVFRRAAAFGNPNAAVFSLDVMNHHAFDSTTKMVIFGTFTDGVVIGDWDGSGTDKIGVYRSATAFGAPGTAVFSLDEKGAFRFDSSSKVFLFGLATDKYVSGRWAYTTASTSPVIVSGNPVAPDAPLNPNLSGFAS